jgi:hypothetical protein
VPHYSSVGKFCRLPRNKVGNDHISIPNLILISSDNVTNSQIGHLPVREAQS